MIRQQPWLGVGWGSTHPLGKIATETGHGAFGLIFWQQVVMVAVLGAIALVRRKGMALTAPALRFYVIVAVLGTLIPNGTFYVSVAHLPAGIMSIIISTVPMLAFPMARILGFVGAAPRPWITLLSSAEALANLCACLPSDLAARWRAQPIVVASERLAVLARAQGFDDVGIARSALGEDLLDAAARRLARHRL